MTTPQPENSPVRDPEKRAGMMLQILKGLKLKIRLLQDPRVSIWLKLSFLCGVLWVVFPDLIVGPIDDAIVFYFLLNFEDLCPQWVVREVLAQMEEEEKGNRPQDRKKAPDNGHKERPTGRFVARINGGPVFFEREEDIPEGVAVWQEFVDRAGQKKWRRYR
jgi:hypothetical protein